MSKKETPLMQQYWEIKRGHPDKILFFRMGDFFELFFDDAVTAAPILDITLTSRNKKSEDETPMCGVPHFSVGGHINKLLSRGYKVAICDQIEDPKQAKGIVKRAVTRVLSPGMVYDPEAIDSQAPNYLCSWDDNAVAFLDPTTGECFYYLTAQPSEREGLIQVIRPVEFVLDPTQQDEKIPFGHKTVFDGRSVDDQIPDSARRLRAYAVSMQGNEILQTLLPFEERPLRSRLQLGAITIRHLEIFETYKGAKEGSLFHAIDRTKSSAGARLLKQWLVLPLATQKEIEARHDRVNEWINRSRELETVRAVLGRMGDIERRLGKLSNPNCNARDLMALAQSVQTGLEANTWLKPPEQNFETVANLSIKVLTTLVDEPSIAKKEGGMIRKGVRPELDHLIDLSTDSQSLLLQMEAREREQTGISSLKIRYNNVFGYYIEVTNVHKDKVPQHYMRKQTLVNAERFITEELQDLERKVLSAKTRRDELEYEVFESLRKECLAATAQFSKAGHYWAEMDVITSLAWLALERKYCRPKFSNKLHIEMSRHPVIEQFVRFVPNTVVLTPGQTLLLTGPNMAGKSTLMRQVALTAILAQVGSFVPATSCELPLYDKILTRIGAADALTEGLSTFMVEMVETAEILKSVTPRSLVIMDEIGRGTSTYDGMSLAQAILEKLAKLGGYVLFATHYHELTCLADEIRSIKNAHMAIREKQGEIQFLHTLTEGPASRSYGIDVASRAGLPSDVITRAKAVLKLKEQGGVSNQLSLFGSSAQKTQENPATELAEKIQALDIEQLTPIQALLALEDLKRTSKIESTIL